MPGVHVPVIYIGHPWLVGTQVAIEGSTRRGGGVPVGTGVRYRDVVRYNRIYH